MSSSFMRKVLNLLESKTNEDLRVEYGYSGREIAKEDETIVWQDTSKLAIKGMLFTLPDGTTYLNDRFIGKTIKPDDPKFTHKKQLYEFRNELKLEHQAEEKGLDIKEFIEYTYEKLPRGRIIKQGNDWVVSVWSDVRQKENDKAIDKLYRYLPEEYK